MRKKILWVSRNNPLQKQVDWLTRWLGGRPIIDTNISPDNNAQAAAYIYQQGGYNYLAAVMPKLWLLHLVNEVGIHPLYPWMYKVENHRLADVTATTGYWKFDRFRRLVGFDIAYAEVGWRHLDRQRQILWVSNHRPMRVMHQALAKMMPEGYQIHRFPSAISSSQMILNLWRSGQYDDLVVNSNLTVIQELLEAGVYPIMHRMKGTRRFDRFMRVESVLMRFEELS